MKRRLLRCVVCAGLAVAALGTTLIGRQAPSAEDLARRHYELGLGFMRDGKYSEALKDFQVVVDSYPTSPVAGDALVQIASYYLDVARDLAAAQSATDIILKKYSATAAAATGYVLNGRIAVEKGPEPANIDTAIASFDRVPALFPASDAVPVAMYYAAEALRAGRQYDKALDRFRDLTQRYPASAWSARALLGSALCLLNGGQAVPATAALQRVRNRFPGSAEAAVALKWNTILYRLYLRPPAQAPYEFSGRFVGSATAKFKDVVAVSLDRGDNLLLAHKGGVAVFDSRGTLVRSIPADSPSALALDLRGTPVIVRDNLMIPEGGAKTISIGIPEPDGKTRNADQVPAAVMTARGEWLVSDRKTRTIHVFTTAGKHVRQFAAATADRLALDENDTVAVLDEDAKTIALLDRTGKAALRVNARGAGYELDDPVDVCFDVLGHIYVLDRGRAAVIVFTPQGRLLASFSIAENSPGAFRKAVAFGLDSAARLYIFDDRAQRVQVYQ